MAAKSHKQWLQFNSIYSLLIEVEQTQLRALRMFFGVGTLHPKVSLLAEMGDLPIRWRAKLWCVLFWVRALSNRVYDGRFTRQVATEAVKFGRGSWLCKMSMCCKEFGWKDVSMEGVIEVGQMQR